MVSQRAGTEEWQSLPPVIATGLQATASPSLGNTNSAQRRPFHACREQPLQLGCPTGEPAAALDGYAPLLPGVSRPPFQAHRRRQPKRPDGRQGGGCCPCSVKAQHARCGLQKNSLLSRQAVPPGQRRASPGYDPERTGTPGKYR